jgi:hypothetical protein
MKTLSFTNLQAYVNANAVSEYAISSLTEPLRRSFENSNTPSELFLSALDTAGLIVESAEVSQVAYFNYTAFATWMVANENSANPALKQFLSDTAMIFNNQSYNNYFVRQFLADAGFLIIP